MGLIRQQCTRKQKITIYKVSSLGKSTLMNSFMYVICAPNLLCFICSKTCIGLILAQKLGCVIVSAPKFVCALVSALVCPSKHVCVLVCAPKLVCALVCAPAFAFLYSRTRYVLSHTKYTILSGFG